MSMIGAALAFLAAAPARWRKEVIEAGAKRRIFELENAVAYFERELAAERSNSAHWKEEARRHAVEARLERETNERRRQRNDFQMLQAQALLQSSRQSLNAQMAMQALGAQNQQALQAMQNQQFAYSGHCNCVPSREQMFAAERRMCENIEALGLATQ
jgi:hypothetical protein